MSVEWDAQTVKIIADRMSDLEHSKDSWEADAFSVITALAEAGLVIVPQEATEKMKQAGGGDSPDKQFLAYAIWRAMVEAAK